MEEHHISVPRTARYHTIGDPQSARELWIVLHGYAQLARFFLRPFVGLDEGRLIAAPEGLSRFYTDADHSRVGSTWMTREDREAEIADQATYLNALATHLLQQCPQGTPLNVFGFSQGVATASRWVMSNSSPINRLVLWGGTLPPELDAADLAKSWRKIKVELVHGEQDPIVNTGDHQRNEARLRASGVPYRTVHFPGGHELDRHTLKRVMENLQ
ncbi:MAG: hypothetical protein ABIY71_09255 [Flavobacteriales bacterium]